MDEGSITGTLVATIESGAASFASNKPLMAGERKLIVTGYTTSSSTTYAAVFSSSFIVTEQSSPTSVSVTGPTSSFAAGTSQTYTVSLYNLFDLPFTTATEITMNLYGGSIVAKLVGTTSVTTSSVGVATFSLIIDGAAGTYYMYPSISGTTLLVKALSVTVTAATAPTSVGISDPGIVGIGVPFAVTVTLYVGEYSVYSASRSVTISLSSGASFTGSTTTATTSSGTYTFSSLLISTSTSEGTYTLTATDTTASISNSIDITVEKQTTLMFSLSSEPYLLKTAGTYTYTLYLSSKPSSTVTVTIASGTTSIITVSPSTITFTTSNYATSQTVTLTIISGGVTDTKTDVSITHSISSSDSAYSSSNVLYYGCDRVSTSGTLTVTVLNTLTPGTLKLTGTFYVVEGSSSSFSIALTSSITDDVVIDLSNSDGLTFSSNQLTFTSSDYSTSQSVTVSAVNGLTGDDSSLLTEINYEVTSTDDNYANAIASSSAYVIVSTVSSSTGVTQSKIPVLNDYSSTTYTLALKTTPSSSVTYTLTSSSSDLVATLSSSTVSSTSAITVTLTHTPTSYPTSLIRTFTISHSLSSSDSNYDDNSRFSISQVLTVYVLITCTYGQYYSSSSYTCVDCPENYRCPSPISIEYCEDGEYSPSGQFECLPCPPGYGCKPSSTGAVACSSGYYSLGSATDCTECPAGSACTVKTTNPADCPLGTYSSAGSTSCTAHTAGNVGFPSESPTTCTSGTIPSAFFTHCEQCPAGHYCSDYTTRTVTPCATGYYSVGGASSCTQCPEGSACSRYAVVGTCPEGYFSLAGQSSCAQCTAGYYCTGGVRSTCSGSYQIGLSSCSSNACPAQHYCIQGLPPMPCPPGYISASGSTTCTACASGEYQTANTCTTCPSGYFCPTPVSPPIACYFGTYSSSGATTCTICDSGYTCGQGSTSATQLDCPSGHYCTSSITAMTGVTVRWPIPCAPGYYNLGSTSDCTACPTGYYCPGGVHDYRKFQCPPGHYCSTTTLVKPTSCSSGYYNPSWGSTSSCTVCADGYFSNIGAPYCLVCPPGYYCASGTKSACSSGTYYFGVRGTTSSVCQSCPKGYFCKSSSDSGTIVPTACPVYTYRTTTGATQSSDCTSCPAGSYCPLPASDNADRLFPCPPGQYCLSGSNSTECAKGYYSDSTTATTSSTCSDCPAGYVCSETGTNSFTKPPTPCPEGYYCPAQSSAGTKCLGGTYSNKNYLKADSECSSCPAGYYCPAGSTYPFICPPGYYCTRKSTSASSCAAGTYNPFRGITISSDCITCPKGYQCTSGTETPTKCSAGTYSDSLGASSCTNCPAGYYCPDTAWIDPLACGKGYYSSASSTSCTICEAGYYCPLEATTATLKSSYLCPAGLYCDSGTDHYPTNLLDRCTEGYYCIESTSTETACSTGKLRRIKGGASSSDCISVEAGYYVSSTGKSSPTGECYAGYYCTGGSTTATQYSCSAGTYRLITGGTSQDDCGSCPAGAYCDPGTSTPTECPTGQYCPEGDSSSPKDCPAGTYSPGKGMYRLSDCTDCPKGYYCSSTGASSKTGQCTAGYLCEGAAIAATGVTASSSSTNPCPSGGYCPAGTPRVIPCAPGKYMPSSGNSATTNCQSCPEGKYCAGASSSATGDCEAGFYCTGGASTSRQNIASAGYYTSAGASGQTACEPGKYNPAKGQSSCLNCPAGFYCSGTGNTAGTICPAGKYCPESSSSATSCGTGTYNPFTGMKASTDCISCPPGYACTTTGMTSVSTTCGAGYWCYTGASEASPSSTVSEKYGPCPVGYYCIAGSSAPRPCSPGTFNSNTVSTSSSACGSCTAGKYCEGFGNSAVTGDCEAGFYCPAGMKVKRPIDYICPAGSKCPTGSSTYTQCTAGTYQANKGQSSCNACPEGFYCTAGTIIFSDYVCPKGYYCPEGTTSSTQYPCSAGTYNPIKGATDDSFCVSCDPGKYCSGTGLSEVTGICDGGYICTGGSTTATPTTSGGQKCTSGYYCPSGGSVQIKCKAGYYCATVGLAEPTRECSAGYYCTGQSTTATPTSGTGAQCPAGYYCEEGSIAPKPCLAGTYNPNSGSTSDSACFTCPEGKYCAGTGLSDASGDCYQGYYCPTGSVSSRANTCSAGYKCPTGSSAQTVCGVGYYQSNKAQSSCNTCPEGYYCSSTTTTTPVLCPAGYYCPSGTSSSTQYPCSSKFYNPAEGRSSSAGCLSCPPGEYCTGTGQSAITGTCTAGYYCPTETESGTSNICTVGNFCPSGSSTTIPCKPGKYCSTTGLSSAAVDCDAGYYCTLGATSNTPSSGSTGGPCPAGYYCPEGTATPTPCPIGTFNSLTTQSDSSSCTSCTAGYYCNQLAATAVSGDCKAGFYCETGSTSETPSDGICPTGSYCPSKSSTYTSCPAGEFGNHEGLAACYDCPAGFTCAGGTDSPVICPAGYYCVARSSSPEACAKGTYTPFEGQFECIDCPYGFYCDDGDDTQFLPIEAPTTCLEGFYCPTGEINPCPSGTYSEIPGLQREDNCKPCPSGKYCTGGVIQDDCEKGHYCVSGSSTPTPTYIYTDSEVGMLCPLGYYCLIGTSKLTACPIGKFTNSEGSDEESDCNVCSAGYYCIPGDTVPYDCPLGAYCPEESQAPIYCGKWSYSDVLNAYEASTCKTCPKGYLCDGEGIGDYTRFPCTYGHYCVADAKTELPCPIGTWGPTHALGSSSECYNCPSGSYCKTHGRATYAHCSNWKWCAEGSSTEGNCPAGYYCHQNTETLSPCFGGYYCPSTSSEADTPPYRCEKGYYCPPGSYEPQECPWGTVPVENSLRILKSDSCAQCPGGTYSYEFKCLDCDPGFVCVVGASKAQPQTLESDGGYPCPPGYYCPIGSSAGSPCPVGFYYSDKGAVKLEDCKPCGAGYYNDLEGQGGCYRCGPNADSVSGSTTCTCKGKKRSYMKRDATCRCEPGYSFYKAGVTPSEEDSAEDCVPTVLPICAKDQFRSQSGLCVSKTDCSKECQGGKGERSPLGICTCYNTASIDDVCDETCRASTPSVKLTSSGNFEVTDPTTGTTTNYDFQSSVGYTGKAYCFSGYNCVVKTTQLSAGGNFESDYQPTLITGSKRRLASDKTLINPVYCLEYGDTMIFSIQSSKIYPVYLKNSLLNTNPLFDYSPFLELQKLIVDGGQNLTSFAYTFSDPGRYVFANNDDPENMIIITVMETTQKCDSPYLRERTSRTLTKVGVYQSSDINEDSDWLNFFFLVWVFIIFIIIVTIVNLFKRRNLKKMMKKNIEAYRQMLTRHASLIKMQNDGVGVSNPEDPNTLMHLGVFGKVDHLNPQIFEDIYRRLGDISALLKERAALQKAQEKEYVINVKKSLQEMKDVVHNMLYPNKPGLQVPSNIGPNLNESSQSGLVFNPSDEPETQRLIEKIAKDPLLNEKMKQELLDELQNNFSNLEAQLAEDRVQAANTLKNRIDQRKRARHELMLKKQKLEEQERNLRDEMQREVKDAESTAQQLEKDFEKEKRRAREKAFGNVAKNMRKELLENIRKNPDNEEFLINQYEDEMMKLERNLDDDKGKAHRDLMKKLEERKNERKRKALINASRLVEEHKGVSSELDRINKQIELAINIEAETQVEVPISRPVDLSEGDERNIDRKFKEQQKNLEIQHDHKQSTLEKQRQKLTNSLGSATTPAERDRILEEMNRVENALQEAVAAREADQKKILSERLKERRRLRKERQEKNQEAVPEFQVNTVNLTDDLRLKRLQDLVNGLPENEKISMIKQLLADKHDQELIDLQSKQQKRAALLHAAILREALDNKAEATRLAPQYLSALNEDQQKQTISSILLEGEKEAQNEFQKQWKDHQRRSNDELLKLLDVQMAEVASTLKKLGIDSTISPEAQELDQIFRARQSEMEREANERLKALENQRNELNKLAKDKQEELEKQIEDHRRLVEIDRAKRELEAKQRREIEEKMRKGQLTQKQMEELIAQHQRELGMLEQNIEAEKKRQREILNKKLQEKNEKKRKLLQVPEDLKHIGVETAQMMKKFRGTAHFNAEFDDNLLDELLRRITRIEQVVANIDENQFTGVMSRLEGLRNGLKG